MQTTSALYKEIIAGDHWFETKLVIGDEFYLIDENENYITFGGTRIYYDSDSGGFGENMLKEVSTVQHIFTDDKPAVGCCVAAEIDVTMVKPTATIARMSSMKPFIRACNSSKQSEWIPKGVFFIDTRSDGESTDEIVFHGYDAMLKAEQSPFDSGEIVTQLAESTVGSAIVGSAYVYTPTPAVWPKTDIDTVKLIASYMGVGVDPRTEAIMTRGYTVEYPAGYTCREVLSFIAAMYVGNFIMSDVGELRLIRLNEIGIETRYLVDNAGNVIKFGGDRILV